MKNDINDFVEEITSNFSELFVETFFLRYLSTFKKDDLLETIFKSQKILNKKLDKKIKNKLNEMGYK